MGRASRAGGAAIVERHSSDELWEARAVSTGRTSGATAT